MRRRNINKTVHTHLSEYGSKIPYQPIYIFILIEHILKLRTDAFFNGINYFSETTDVLYILSL